MATTPSNARTKKSPSKKAPAKKNAARKVIEIHNPKTGKLAGSRSTVGSEERDIPKANRAQLKVDLSKLSFFEKLDLAQYRKAPDETLRALAKEESFDIRIKVALNPKTSDALKIEMAKKDLDIGEILAEDINTSVPVLRELARISIILIKKDIDSRANNILLAVASHRHAPKDLLINLAKSPYFEVRCSVAENANTPIRTLNELSEDESPYVRASVSLNSKVTPQLLEKLSKDQEWAVRHEVAFNEKTPEAILMTFIDEPLIDFRLALVRNDAFPADGLLKLVQFNEPEVTRAVLKHPNVSAKILTQLSNHDDEDIQLSVLHHTKTPAKIKAQIRDSQARAN